MNIVKIYIDNFREFYDTTIPLEKINFLVGENSTGKTSILKLIDLLSSSEFWFNGNFRTDNVDFSYYGDVSSSVNNKSEGTKIGILYEQINEDKSKTYSAVLMTIAGESKKKTILKTIRCAYEGKELDVQVKKRLAYKLTEETSFSPENFTKWCKEEPIVGKYTLSKKELTPYMNNSPFFIINVLSREHEGKADNKSLKLTQPPFTEIVAPFTWIAPIRVKPQLTYDGNIYDYSSDGAHAPYLLKTIMSKKRSARTKRIVSILEEFGKESGLFDAVSVKQFAKSGNSPFSIEVITGGVRREITNVGYGVSQILPIIIEILMHSSYRFAIQQPEVHLHPRAQASLGSFFFKMINDYNAHFTIETHSDFVIDRFRQQVAKSKAQEVVSQVLFFEHNEGKNIVHSIEIETDGSYADTQPDSFRSFFFNEELRNIAI